MAATRIDVAKLARRLRKAKKEAKKHKELLQALENVSEDLQNPELSRICDQTLEMVAKVSDEISGKSPTDLIDTPASISTIISHLKKLAEEVPTYTHNSLASIKPLLSKTTAEITSILTRASDVLSPSESLEENITYLKKIKIMFQEVEPFLIPENPQLIGKLTLVSDLLETLTNLFKSINVQIEACQLVEEELNREIKEFTPTVDRRIARLKELQENNENIPLSDSIKNRITITLAKLQKAKKELEENKRAKEFKNIKAAAEEARAVAERHVATPRNLFRKKSSYIQIEEQIDDIQSDTKLAIEKLDDIPLEAFHFPVEFGHPSGVEALKKRLQELLTALDPLKQTFTAAKEEDEKRPEAELEAAPTNFDLSRRTMADNVAPRLKPLLEEKKLLLGIIRSAQFSVMTDTEKTTDTFINELNAAIESVEGKPGNHSDLIHRLKGRRDFFVRQKEGLQNPTISFTHQVHFIKIDLPNEIARAKRLLQEAHNFIDSEITKLRRLIRENITLIEDIEAKAQPEHQKNAIAMLAPFKALFQSLLGKLKPFEANELLSSREEALQEAIKALQGFHGFLLELTCNNTREISDFLPHLEETGAMHNIVGGIRHELSILNEHQVKLKEALDVKPYSFVETYATWELVKIGASLLENLRPLLQQAKSAIEAKQKSFPDQIKTLIGSIETKIKLVETQADKIKISAKQEKVNKQLRKLKEDLFEIKIEFSKLDLTPEDLRILKLRSQKLLKDVETLLQIAKDEETYADRLLALTPKINEIEEAISKVNGPNKLSLTTSFLNLKAYIDDTNESEIPTDVSRRLQHIEYEITELLRVVYNYPDPMKSKLSDYQKLLANKIGDVKKAIEDNKGRDRDGLDDIVKLHDQLTQLQEERKKLDQIEIAGLDTAGLFQLKHSYEDLLKKTTPLHTHATQTAVAEEARYQDERKKTLHSPGAKLKKMQRDYLHIHANWHKNIEFVDYWLMRTAGTVSRAEVRESLDHRTRGILIRHLHELRRTLEFYKDANHDTMGVLSKKKSEKETNLLLKKISAIETNLIKLHKPQTEVPVITHIKDGAVHAADRDGAQSIIDGFLGSTTPASPLGMQSRSPYSTIERDTDQFLVRKYETYLPTDDDTSPPERMKHCTLQEFDKDTKTFTTSLHITEADLQKLAAVPDEGLFRKRPGKPVRAFVMTFLKEHHSDPLGDENDAYILPGLPRNVTKGILCGLKITGKKPAIECLKYIDPNSVTDGEAEDFFDAVTEDNIGFYSHDQVVDIHKKQEEARPPSLPRLTAGTRLP